MINLHDTNIYSKKKPRKQSKEKSYKKKRKYSKKYKSEKPEKSGKFGEKRIKKKSEKSAKCCKCGKIGHYANKCLTKKKISKLQIDEGLRQQLCKLMLNFSDSESSTEQEINDISTESDSESTESNNSPRNFNCNNLEGDCSTSDNYWKAIVEMNGLSINVLTDQQKSLLDLIDQIQDPQLKMKIIENCLSSVKEEEEEKPSIPVITYSLKEVLNRISANDNSKPVTISDLKGEINTLKSEIMLLKTFQSKATQDLAAINHRLNTLTFI